MNKKDKIEARKAVFDLQKVFIIYAFVFSNIDIHFVNFKFLCQNIEIKKNIVI